MKKFLLIAMTILFTGLLFAADPDDGSWVTRRAIYADRLNMSAQEVLNLFSRKLIPGPTGYLALEVVASEGNFKVAISTSFYIVPELSAHPTDYNLSVSSFAVTTITGNLARVQILIANNDTANKLFYRYSSISDIATKGSFLSAGAVLVEDRYKGNINLLATAGIAPIDIRIIDYIK